MLNAGKIKINDIIILLLYIYYYILLINYIYINISNTLYIIYYIIQELKTHDN